MLNYDAAELARKLAEKFDCKIELPEAWADYFGESGLLGGGHGDRRQFPRMRFRTPAVLEYRQTLPVLPRPRKQYLVYLRDFSRSGVGFLHHEQLYPREQMRLTIPPGRVATPHKRREGIIEIIRCTRIQRRCFVIGASYVERPRDVQPATAPERVAADTVT